MPAELSFRGHFCCHLSAYNDIRVTLSRARGILAAWMILLT
ncbi:hypothetical protein [Burkholderia sp. SIMBA_062]